MPEAERGRSARLGTPVADQSVAAGVHLVNEVRRTHERAALGAQDAAFGKAVEQIDKVREFLGSPEKILGNPATKHGEIAERVEVGVQNARAALLQQEMPATLPDSRTGPADYFLGTTAVQSKFINGAANNLDEVLGHMGKYPGFTGEGGIYQIPQDTHQVVMAVARGEDVEGLSARTQAAIAKRIAEIEATSGRPFGEVVKPAISEYSEVQQGKVHQTLDRHEEELSQRNDELNEEVRDDHAPSVAGALGAAAGAAAVAGAVSLAVGLYAKHKEGKNPFRGDFNADDWKDVGLDVAAAAASGAVTGASVYALTNWVGMSAPFAGAFVTAAKGVGTLSAQLAEGSIDADQFVDMGLMVCSEAAIVALASAVGQGVIPIPILGGLIGSAAGKLLVELAASGLSGLEDRLRRDMDEYLARLDQEEARLFARIQSEFDRIGALTEAAFSPSKNGALLAASVALAEAHGVRSSLIIRDSAGLDAFMLA